MGFKESPGYCSYCEKDVLIRTQTPNHILHLILSIVTSGIWLIVWVILSLRAKEWHCSKCGKRVSLSFGDKGGVAGSHMKRIKECAHCGAKNRAEDYVCVNCSQPI